MSKTLDQVEAEALSLPAEDREKLIDALFASLDADESADINPEAIAEAKRRYEDLRSGVVRPITRAEMFASLRADLSERGTDE